MIRSHEAIVHFPIALFLSAFLFSIIGLFYKRPLLKEIVFWNLFLGILATGAAVYSGFIDQQLITDRHLQEHLELHRRNAFILCVLLVSLTSWLGWRKSTMRNLEYFAWISIFFVASTSVGYQGYLGHDMTAKIHKKEIEATKSSTNVKQLDYGWNF
jgi:uncharacterized membrane protein